MAEVDGTWDTVTKSPMGDQKATLTVVRSGDTFTGSYSGAMGSTDISEGRVDGNRLTWKVSITVPMPMTLDCEATVEGDAMSGTVTAGAFGSFPLTGTRQA
ncbi:hypothetical protein [Stakelama saccharophila]|uniref:Uncharacterized protein n=1 Tax=Stakelama saccharophila TaxID=3075605 RepID=A0ABZ0BB78_9SPHN|nr:hypothetical protein [Stakelama sp. W311]WNO54682.1 hypothetical protein RPR59_05370 [Stakelama sp. W311]